MGHLIRIVNIVIQNVGANEVIEEAMKVLDEDTLTRWREYVSGPIAEANLKNETNLVSL